jgi:sec-independent protein translocase protein TatB
MSFLNNIGGMELLVILLLALLVVGPERLPEMSRKLGALVRDVRKMIETASRDLDPDLAPVQKAAQDVIAQVDAVKSLPHDMIRSISRAAGLSDVAADLGATVRGTNVLTGSPSAVDPSLKGEVPAATALIDTPAVELPLENRSRPEKPVATNWDRAVHESPPAKSDAAQETRLNG